MLFRSQAANLGGLSTSPQKGDVAGQQTQAQPTPAFQPDQADHSYPWWIWLIIIILHLWIVGAYSFFVRPESSGDEYSSKSAQQPELDRKSVV